MYKSQRQLKIIELIDENDGVGVAALAELLECSKMTIRRDLDEIEQRGLINKVHGGAVKIKSNSLQPSFANRVIENREEKEAIAREAVKLIGNGSVVFFDGGTTPLYVAKKIPLEISFTAVTNSLMTACELCDKPNVNIIMLGGELHHSSYSAVNSMPLSHVKRFYADLALISTRTVSYPEGLFESMLPLIDIKKALVSSSEKVVLLADHTKFTSKSLCMSVPFSDIDQIITDSKTDPEVIEKIRGIGVAVSVVDV